MCNSTQAQLLLFSQTRNRYYYFRHSALIKDSLVAPIFHTTSLAKSCLQTESCESNRFTVPKSVTLNDLERRNGRYFALCHRIRHRKTIIRPTSVSKPTFDSLDHTNMICAIIQRLFGRTNSYNSIWWAQMHRWLAARTFENQLHPIALAGYEAGTRTSLISCSTD